MTSRPVASFCRWPSLTQSDWGSSDFDRQIPSLLVFHLTYLELSRRYSSKVDFDSAVSVGRGLCRSARSVTVLFLVAPLCHSVGAGRSGRCRVLAAVNIASGNVLLFHVHVFRIWVFALGVESLSRGILTSLCFQQHEVSVPLRCAVPNTSAVAGGDTSCVSEPCLLDD